MNNVDLLSYKPDLSINRKIDVESLDISTNERSESNEAFSSTFSYFKSNPPSSVIQYFDTLEGLINTTLTSIEGKITSSKYYIAYQNASNEDDKNDIKESNSNDLVLGDSSLEYHAEVVAIKDFIKDISLDFKEYFYGERGITTDDAKTIDNTMIERLENIERSGSVSKINYFSIATDCKVVCLLEQFLSRIEALVYHEVFLISHDYTESIGNKELEYILSEEFATLNELLSNDYYKRKFNCENFKIALKNVFLSKQLVNSCLDRIINAHVNSDVQPHGVLNAVLSRQEENLNESVDALTQTVIMSEFSEKDIFDCISKKKNLRSVFSRNDNYLS